jgi:TonB family protein
LSRSSGLRIIQGSDRNYGVISTSVQIKRSQLKTVYNKELRNSPNLEGNVILEFVVSPAGTVLKCNILTSSLENPAFEEALIQEILQWRFPKVKEGTTTILFPISFFPTG